MIKKTKIGQENKNILKTQIIKMITLFIIGALGKHWGKKWISQGVMTEEEMYELGYLGCFFGKIFGF